MNITPLQPWMISDKTGTVLAAHCNCMAGLGEACSHVGAMLFAIEATVKVRDSKTVTQEKAYWLLPSGIKKVEYKTIREIDFKGANSKKRELDRKIENINASATPKPTKTKEPTPIPPPTESELDTFFAQLGKSSTKPVIILTSICLHH